MSPILALQMPAQASRSWAAPMGGTLGMMNRPKYGQTCLLAMRTAATPEATPKAPRTRFTSRMRAV